MKKLIFFTSVLILPVANLQGQDLSFGAKAGLNLSTLQPELTDSRTAFHLGGMVEISLSDVFSVQPELLYSAHGAKDQNDSNGDEIFKVDYLSLPVLAKYYVVDGLSLEAGPQLGFLLSSKQEDNGETDDLKDITKSTDFGFSLGVGYKMDSGLNFGLRYYLGSDVNDIDTDSEEFKNRVFQLSVGYFFN